MLISRIPNPANNGASIHFLYLCILVLFVSAYLVVVTQAPYFGVKMAGILAKDV
jgi:hypothetical protein